jgi:hypothetical protein
MPPRIHHPAFLAFRRHRRHFKGLVGS